MTPTRSWLTVDVDNVNDNAPEISGDTTYPLTENTARDTLLGVYTATDADGDAVSFAVGGNDAKSFRVVDKGLNTDGEYVAHLMTLESLDADSGNTLFWRHVQHQCNRKGRP